MRKMILKKIIVATFATLIWCLLLSVIGYILKGEPEPNSSYMTFMEDFVLYFIFIAPMYLTVGILFSIVVEMKNKSIFKTIVTYVIGGGIIGFLFYLLVFVLIQGIPNLDVLISGVIIFISYGATSALFFYGIQIVLKPLFSKLNLN